MANKYQKTSVVIITRNRDESLYRCLNSLIKQQLLPTEVIVVDNASNDNTKNVVSSFQKELNLKYLYEPVKSIPKSRNKGLNAARFDLILILDDDCVANRNWVDRINNAHQRNPTATVIQGYTVSIPKNSIYSLIMQQYRSSRIANGLHFNKPELFFDSNNISIKRNKLIKLNLHFDETIIGGGSDLDFAARIINNGGTILFDEKIVVYHKERNNLLAFLFQRYERGKTPVKLKRRWPEFQFHYGKIKISQNLKTMSDILLYLINKRRYSQLILLPSVFLLSMLFFKYGTIRELVRGRKP